MHIDYSRHTDLDLLITAFGARDGGGPAASAAGGNGTGGDVSGASQSIGGDASTLSLRELPASTTITAGASPATSTSLEDAARALLAVGTTGAAALAVATAIPLPKSEPASPRPSPITASPKASTHGAGGGGVSSASPSSAHYNHPFEMSMAINALEAARCNHPFEMSMAINALEAAATPAVLKEELSSASSPLHASAPASAPASGPASRVASRVASGRRSSPSKPSAASSHTSPAWPSPYAQAMRLVRRSPSRGAVLGTARLLRSAVGSARGGAVLGTVGRRGGRAVEDVSTSLHSAPAAGRSSSARTGAEQRWIRNTSDGSASDGEGGEGDPPHHELTVSADDL